MGERMSIHTVVKFIVVSRCSIMISPFFFFFQAEDGIRDLVRSRGLGDVYKRQVLMSSEVVMSFFIFDGPFLAVSYQLSVFSKLPALSLIHI